VSAGAAHALGDPGLFATLIVVCRELRDRSPNITPRQMCLREPVKKELGHVNQFAIDPTEFSGESDIVSTTDQRNSSSFSIIG
jgi:hypothetical protein